MIHGTIGNIYLPNTVIIMPFTNTEITATYRDQGATLYSLLVNNGDGDGIYPPGVVVNIVADIAPANQVFDKWVGQTTYIANINLPNTTIHIQFSSVTVIATYKSQGATTYTLTVTNGTGEGTYLPGAVVNITANAAPANQVFDKWVGQTANIANINLPNTSIHMQFYSVTVIATYKSQSAAKYTLTVNSGTGDGDYLPGTVVNISADAPVEGQVFDKWAGNTANITNINLPDTTIVMPSQAAAVTATYKAHGEYTLTVTGGAGGGSYLPGTIVTISANVPEAGKVFDKWVGDTANIANIFLPNTTIYTPFYAATVVATYKTRGETPYTLTVNRGSGDGDYLPGTVVNISADAPAADQVFDKWAGDTANIININLPDTTIVMPSHTVAVTATYKTQDDTYELTVYSGTGGGTYTEGTVVSISANTSEAGIVFDKWTGDSTYIANINLPNTTFVMPYHAAVVTATYKTQGGTVNTLTVTNGTGGGTYPPGTVVGIAANKAIEGKIFDKWIGNTANIENINLPNTIIVMPFLATEITATYIEQGSTEYTLTVTGGAGGGSYSPGTIVTISANVPEAGKVFDKWVGDTANIANIFLPNTTIYTPFYPATVVATYKTRGETPYTLTVNRWIRVWGLPARYMYHLIPAMTYYNCLTSN